MNCPFSLFQDYFESHIYLFHKIYLFNNDLTIDHSVGLDYHRVKFYGLL